MQIGISTKIVADWQIWPKNNTDRQICVSLSAPWFWTSEFSLVLIYLFSGFFDKDDDLKTEFKKAAGEMREKYKFVHTESEEVMTDKGHRE